MNKSLLILVAVIAVAELAFGQAVSDYYPFNVGNYWVQQNNSGSGEQQSDSFRVEIEGVDLIDGSEYFRMKQSLLFNDGAGESTWYTWLRRNSEGMVLGAFGQTPEFVEITIQNATIIVDGDASDWNGIDPVVTDMQGDDSGLYAGDDLKAVYAAKDNTNLYVRMDVWGNANTNFSNSPSPDEGRYMFNISGNGPYGFMHFGIAYDRNNSRWSLGYNGSDTVAGLKGPEYVGVQNGVIELKVPLSAIGNPTDYYEIGAEVNTCCIQDWYIVDEVRFMSTKFFYPPLTWLPNEMINLGNTWAFDAPEMGGYYRFSVESISETVSVPAGTFNDCLKIKNVIVNTFGDTTQMTHFYYAPGVGQVLNSGWNWSQGNVKFELEDYSVILSSTDKENTGDMPTKFLLHQNHPNPFNPLTTISYSILRSELVSLKVYDLTGREIQTLVSEVQNIGSYSINLDASDLASGIYLYKLQVGDFGETKKMTLIK
jgi:hypothetical protein